MYYSTICAIAKDEEHFIVDWLNYHFAIGFDKIFVFDNNSELPLKTFLAGYISQGIVQVFEIKESCNQQLSAYASFLKEFPNISKWIAFIDIDEFILPKKVNDFRVLLEKYESYAALGISWKVFGSNGHMSRPKQNVIQAYDSVVHDHNLIKSIVQPKKTLCVKSPHHFLYNNEFCVNEDYIPIIGPRSYHTSETVQINHYYFKSQQDFELKVERGYATQIKNSKGYSLNSFYDQSKKNDYKDISIKKFLDIVGLYNENGPDYISYNKQYTKHINANELIEKISKMILSGMVDDAISMVKNALRYHKNPALFLTIARLYVTKKKYNCAIFALQKLINTFSENKEVNRLAYMELANIYRYSGAKDKSESVLRFISD